MFLKEEVDYKNYAAKILSDMEKNLLGIDSISTLLIGEPGTGKTSFVKFLSRLLGLPLVLIEVPHISEEHLINIPFLVINKEGVESEKEVLDSDFRLVRAKSVLASTLERQKPLSEEEHMEFLKREPGGLGEVLYEEYRDRINFLRDNFNCIMFFDEFYRVRSPRITNILRTFLNGKIGLDDIPSGVYTIYASNINSFSDEGLSDIPLNHQFKTILFETPGVEEWFGYMKHKHRSVLEPSVLPAFRRVAEENGLFFEDFEAEVRVSPRRMEEIVLYLNFLKITGSGKEYAREFLRVNTTNYLTGSPSSHYHILSEVVEELFGDSNVKLDWIQVLKNQLELKQKMGSSRTYVPCLSGKPGVSKTSTVNRLGEELGVNVIAIDCATLNPEDTIGLPNIKSGNQDVQEVFFTEPMLYSLIMEGYRNAPKTEVGGKYRHILFLDEINRTTPAVFNSIRKLVLDKEVNEDYPLPEDIMVVAALNPDGEGTVELTPHLRDVLDIINATPLFGGMLDYIGSFEHVRHLKSDYGVNAQEYIRSLFEKISLRFGSEVDEVGEGISNPNEKYFYLLTADGNTIYLSPREMTAMSLNILYDLRVYMDGISYDRYRRYEPQEYAEFEKAVGGLVFNVFKDNLRFVGLKQGVENSEIERTIALYINHLSANEPDLFRVLENVYSEISVSVFEMLKNADFDLTGLDGESFLFEANNYILNADSLEQVVNDLNDLLDYVVNKMEVGSYPELFRYYLDLYLVLSRLDFSKWGNQLQDRVSKLFVYNYVAITEKIRSESEMFLILEEVANASFLSEEKYQCFFDKYKGALKQG